MSVNGKTAFVSDGSGNLTVDGLFAGVKGAGKDYWLVETKAPVGYTADTTPIKVTVKPGSIEKAEVVKVLNTQVPPPILPLTGGDGAVMFGIGGAALVLMAAGAAVVIARRRVRV
ncbi:SpaA isopeptide-forming pilin-related protein [Microbacterium aurantiacum]|uniref:SpaA isopeptide-forming pilin-related protein n=1 Tax=Microbacterium aurantiacum TaxID=162393 RepID=UPI0040368DB4